MNIQNIFIFLAIFICSLAVYFISERNFGLTIPWIIFFAIGLAFISYLIVKKTNYNWGLVAVIIAAIGLFSQWGWNAYQDYSNKESRHQHVKPNISCFIEYPIKTEGDKTFRDKRNPQIVIKNDGPIKAVSVTADIKIYVYDEEKDQITNYADMGFMSFDHSLSAQELLPFNELRQSCIGINREHWVAVYYVKVNYYRQSDMKQYSSKYYFFTKQQEILEVNELQKNGKYNGIIEKVKSFAPSESAGSVKITKAQEHIWFVESDGSVAITKNADGKLVVQTPKEQGDTPQAGYPFLEIKPTRFKATGFCIDAKIVDDLVEIIIPFKAKNIGDSAANLTKDGFDIIATIDSGKALHTKKKIQVAIKEGSPITLKDYLNIIDTDERIFKYRFFVYYRPADKPDELFKVVVHYNIGKNGFDPVLSEPDN